MFERQASFIGVFRDNNNNKFEHQIFCHEDDRVECVDSKGNVVLTHKADCYTKSPDGKYIGHWGIDREGNWKYTNNNSGKEYTFGRDLLKAEMEISKLYVNGELA